MTDEPAFPLEVEMTPSDEEKARIQQMAEELENMIWYTNRRTSQSPVEKNREIFRDFITAALKVKEREVLERIHNELSDLMVKYQDEDEFTVLGKIVQWNDTAFTRMKESMK